MGRKFHLHRQYLDLLEKKRREEDRAFQEILDQQEPLNFDLIPDEPGDWRDGLRVFYARNHALIEEYPEGCTIARNAQALENLLLSFFGDLLEGTQS
jgi:hypothetical protein